MDAQAETSARQRARWSDLSERLRSADRRLIGRAGVSSVEPLALPRRWQVIVTGPLGAAANMSLDHALARRAAATDEAVLRCYTWRQPTLSFGRNQSAIAAYDRSALAREGWDIVRRPTGGRAVLHGHEITYSVTAPLRRRSDDAPPDPPGLRAWYVAINQLLVNALQRLGVPAMLASETAGARSLGPRPCFDDAVSGEVVVFGRKLIGSAQWREGNALLQHGSILIADDQALLERIAPGVCAAPVATLRDYLASDPTAADIADATVSALDEKLTAHGREPSGKGVIDTPTEQAARALQAHYEDAAWTWRR
jgi:lipoyl(octanoyl) transferase